jgi:hypothetical protein
MNRLKSPIEEITKALLSGDRKVLNIDTLNELLGLFPLKSYEEEKALMADYKGPKNQLAKAEQLLYELITIPRIRELLSSFIFTIEAESRIADLEAVWRSRSYASVSRLARSSVSLSSLKFFLSFFVSLSVSLSGAARRYNSFGRYC